jgi:type IV fimbrial biogenesis protein FimT
MTIRRTAESNGRPPVHWAGGFTLIEMMTAIFILALLVTLAVPSFNDASLSGKLTGLANDLVASAQLARSEAIKRNAAVTLCASGDGATCDDPGDGWSVGWIVLGADGVIERHPPLPREFRILDGGVSSIVFPAVIAGTTVANLTVCRAEPAGSQERVVAIGASGGTRVNRTETGTCPE